MRVLAIIVGSLFVFPAAAQEWPNLLGVWKGKTRSVIAGSGGHFEGADVSGAHFREVELTVEWIQQNDGRFIGTITSANHSENKIGVIASDRKTFYTVDHDGHSNGRIVDDDHFELCYMQTSSGDRQMVASCVTFERQR